MASTKRSPKAAGDWHVYEQEGRWRLVELPRPGSKTGEVVGTADERGVALCAAEVAPAAVLALLLRSAPREVIEQLCDTIASALSLDLGIASEARMNAVVAAARRALDTGDKA